MSDTQIIRVTPLEWALAMHESEGRLAPRGPAGEPTAKRKAYRPEPKFRRRYVDSHRDAHLWGSAEREMRSTSFGCWQIMGQFLRELGYVGDIVAFASAAELQLHFMRLAWQRVTDKGDPLWRLAESWNKGDAGEDKLTGPTDYWHSVEAWLQRAPAPGPDGLVEMLTVEKKMVLPLRR